MLKVDFKITNRSFRTQKADIDKPQLKNSNAQDTFIRTNISFTGLYTGDIKKFYASDKIMPKSLGEEAKQQIHKGSLNPTLEALLKERNPDKKRLIEILKNPAFDPNNEISVKGLKLLPIYVFGCYQDIEAMEAIQRRVDFDVNKKVQIPAADGMVEYNILEAMVMQNKSHAAISLLKDSRVDIVNHKLSGNIPLCTLLSNFADNNPEFKRGLESRLKFSADFASYVMLGVSNSEIAHRLEDKTYSLEDVLDHKNNITLFDYLVKNQNTEVLSHIFKFTQGEEKEQFKQRLSELIEKHNVSDYIYKTLTSEDNLSFQEAYQNEIASNNPNMELLDKLIKKEGIDINKVDCENGTYSTMLTRAKDIKELRVLLSLNGINPNKKMSGKLSPAVFVFYKEKKYDMFSEIVNHPSFNPDILDKDNQNLSDIIKTNNQMQELLAAKKRHCFAKYRDEYEQTSTVSMNHIKEFITQNVSLSLNEPIISKRNETMLQLFLNYSNIPAHAAEINEINELLFNKPDVDKIDFSQRDANGNTLLMQAILSGNIEFAKFCMSKMNQALIMDVNDFSQTAAEIAQKSGNPELIRLFS